MKACVEKVGERAISEVFMKLFECVMKDKQPAGVDQSTVSSDERADKLSEIILCLVEMKMEVEADPLEKAGAMEILTELLPQQRHIYTALTTKEAFEVLSGFLVSEDPSCERHAYALLNLLISNYEQYERFQKRINVDNFEEDLQPINNSGSFTQAKQNNSKNTELRKDIAESTLFQFVKVVVSNITCEAIQTKFNQISEAKVTGQRVPLGMHFMALMEFLAKASSVFSGFKNDINATLIEKDVFNQILTIIEYYSEADLFNRQAFSILEAIVRNGRSAIVEMNKSINAGKKSLI